MKTQALYQQLEGRGVQQKVLIVLLVGQEEQLPAEGPGTNTGTIVPAAAGCSAPSALLPGLAPTYSQICKF